MLRKKVNPFVFACLLLIIGMAAGAQLGSILKGGGVALLVTEFGPEINKALNRLTKTDTSRDFDTKVVTVISAGSGTHVGAVQVAGPRDQVEKVVAVAQIEGKFNPVGIRVRALVPIASKDVKSIKRVPGVGISGLLDVKL